ncbi:MAG: NAD(P)/FAD-dependent oxidoreductase [Gaiellaceae bacterium]
MISAQEAEIVVVGAGASGLSAAACLARHGRRPVVVHRDERVGGTWRGRYDRLHLHTTRRFSGLPFHPIPRSYGRFVSKDDYARYLEEYAERLALDVRNEVDVSAIAPAESGWRLETDNGSWSCSAVVVATGRHRRKVLPEFPGAEAFGGAIVHSADYGSGRSFAGRKVLVVGIGNSGAEIAADLAEQGASRVEIAVRTSPPIVSRQIAGIPVQLFGILLSPLPGAAVDRAAAKMRRFALGDLAPYGLGPPGWGSFSEKRPAVIDVGFVRELKAGRVRVRPDLHELRPGGAVFSDGSEEDFDVVVAATGFRTGLDDLLDVSGALDAGGLPREGASHPGLFFAGFTETVRGQLYEANRAAGGLAASVDAFLSGAPR